MVLHRDRDAVLGLELAHALDELRRIGALPAERRVGHHGRAVELTGHADALLELRPRVPPPHVLQEEQGGGVQREDRLAVLGRQRPQGRHVPRRGLDGDHDLDPVVADVPGEAEAVLDLEGEHRRAREADGDATGGLAVAQRVAGAETTAEVVAAGPVGAVAARERLARRPRPSRAQRSGSHGTHQVLLVGGCESCRLGRARDPVWRSRLPRRGPPVPRTRAT